MEKLLGNWFQNQQKKTKVIKANITIIQVNILEDIASRTGLRISAEQKISHEH